MCPQWETLRDTRTLETSSPASTYRHHCPGRLPRQPWDRTRCQRGPMTPNTQVGSWPRGRKRGPRAPALQASFRAGSSALPWFSHRPHHPGSHCGRLWDFLGSPLGLALKQPQPSFAPAGPSAVWADPPRALVLQVQPWPWGPAAPRSTATPLLPPQSPRLQSVVLPACREHGASL